MDVPQWAAEVFPSEELAGTLFSTSIRFDLSVFEIFAPLSRGGAVIVADNVLQLPRPVPCGARHAHQHGSFGDDRTLAARGVPSSVLTVNLAGERLPGSLVHGIYDATRVEKLYNLYGPTEDTTYSTFALIDRGTEAPTIGRPIANTRVYVLDPPTTGACGRDGGALHRGRWSGARLPGNGLS